MAKSSFTSAPMQITLWRFAEIEMLKAYDNIRLASGKHIKSRKFAANHLIFLMFPEGAEARIIEHVYKLFSSVRYRPTKEELSNYFRYLGYGVNTINQLTGISPITVRKYQTERPVFPPYIEGWEELYQPWQRVRDHVKIYI